MSRTRPPRRKESSSFTPTYRRLRRRTGRDLAFVEVDGRRRYLGPYDDPESRERYLSPRETASAPSERMIAVS